MNTVMERPVVFAATSATGTRSNTVDIMKGIAISLMTFGHTSLGDVRPWMVDWARALLRGRFYIQFSHAAVLRRQQAFLCSEFTASRNKELCVEKAE